MKFWTNILKIYPYILNTSGNLNYVKLDTIGLTVLLI